MFRFDLRCHHRVPARRMRRIRDDETLRSIHAARAVQAPAGNKVAMETVGMGEITYQCGAKANTPGQFEWVFVGPDAKLMDRNGKQVGKYYGPPATWESMDGSKVTATQLAVAPASSGSIPLQLVKANPAMGSGAMTGTTYIQRVATQGGVAPSMAVRCRQRRHQAGRQIPGRLHLLPRDVRGKCGRTAGKPSEGTVRRQLWKLSYSQDGWARVYYTPITPTPLSPLLLRGELVRPSVPRLAYCPQAESLGVLFLSAVSVDEPKKMAPALMRRGPAWRTKWQCELSA